MVASTAPSTTKVSQSVISTPFSLMLGPTVSLLSPGLEAASGVVVAAGVADCAGVMGAVLVWRADALLV
jgi:hypothetical protein